MTWDGTADAGYQWYTIAMQGRGDSGNNGNNYFGIDNISVQVTPIPAAVWLLGTGLIGLVGIRRRFVG